MGLGDVPAKEFTALPLLYLVRERERGVVVVVVVARPGVVVVGEVGYG